MTPAPPKIAKVAWRMLPGSLRRKLRTNTGKRFMRFVPVSIAAVAASQLTLALLVGLSRLSAGTSAVLASMAGAAVSYVLSRWAWERKGRPHVIKETLPFWAISVSAWIVLGVVSHFASVWAVSMGLGHWQRVAVVNAAYLMANCVTFVTRFVLFHYVLFADRGSRVPPGSAGGTSPFTDPGGEPAPVAVVPGGTAGPEGPAAPGGPDRLAVGADRGDLRIRR
jgi:putative flippase GtrA